MSDRTLNIIIDIVVIFAVGAYLRLAYYVFQKGVAKGRSLSEN